VNSINALWQYLVLGIKGMAMGAANVIPGVSGGTIALITGIFERLINALKSINLTAIKLFFTGKWKEFAHYIQLDFLIAVFAGIFISIFSIAKLLDYLFKNYPVLIWAFFFGLIIASIYYVGKTISRWKLSVIIIFIIGAVIAVGISLFKPAQENTSLYYLLICGIVAICSMILPGLSGSFILILMGNYQLIMIDSVSNLDWEILIPVGIGAVIGLLAFSHLLSWIYKRFRNQTIGILTGFMAGSLMILWPWKNEIFSHNSLGTVILNRSGEPLLEGYQYLLPDTHNTEFWIALACMLLGFLAIAFVEWQGRKLKKTDSE
jgi:putative membrane protein